MSALEIKEKDLNKLKAKVDTLLKNNHPASDKIEVWTDPLIMCIYGEFSDQFTFMYYVWEPYLFCVCASLQAYRDTLQTQWSWLLQITKCIDVHLKENAAYNQVTGQNVQLKAALINIYTLAGNEVTACNLKRVTCSVHH